MLKWIEETRKKPKAVRNQYAFVGAFAVTALITIVWMVSLPLRFASLEEGYEPAPQSPGAFSRFWGQAKQQWASIIQSAKEDSSESSASSETDASVLIPELTNENRTQVQQKASSTKTASEKRTVLIATTSSETAPKPE